MTPTILVVDDDAELCELMTEYLSQHGYRVDVAADGRAGLGLVLGTSYDLVILDGMLPVLDGLEVLAQLRRRSDVPVIMLTARTSQQDRIAGFEAGADDYLPKPFDAAELLARIRAVLRRSRTASVSTHVVQAGSVRLNTATRDVWRHETPLTLTTFEFDILDLLVRSAGRVVSRDAIAAVLYQRQALPFERSVDVHVSHLRRKLGRDGARLIRTLRGSGYLFWPE